MEVQLYKKLSSASGSFNLDLEFSLKKGDFLSIYGKSGAGKTSIIRILAGLMSPESGFIKVNNQIWTNTEEGINIPTQKRSIGYVFQEAALFPNMSVLENLEFAFYAAPDKSAIEKVTDIMELGALIHKSPKLLSGGQKQRVAIGRALLRKPELLLLDEPFTGLDLALREKMHEYISRIHQSFEMYTIMVSHNRNEVVKLSDKILILENGQKTKFGSPAEIFQILDWSEGPEITSFIVEVEQDHIVISINNNLYRIPKNPGYQYQKGEKVTVDLAAIKRMHIE